MSICGSPALVAHERAAKLGVERVDRHEEVDRRRLPFLEAEVGEPVVAGRHRRRDLAVDIDHVEALLDARRHLDRLDRLAIGGKGRRAQGERQGGDGGGSNEHAIPLFPELHK